MTVTLSELQKHVERLHDRVARYERTELVREGFKGALVWEGDVFVFNVDHPNTDTCFAWSSPVEGSENRKFYAVLKVPPVGSAQEAVRAAIISDYRK